MPALPAASSAGMLFISINVYAWFLMHVGFEKWILLVHSLIETDFFPGVGMEIVKH